MKKIISCLTLAILTVSTVFADTDMNDSLQEVIHHGCDDITSYPFSKDASALCFETGEKLLRSSGSLSPAKFALKLCSALPQGGFLKDDFRMVCFSGVTSSSNSSAMRDIASECVFAFGNKAQCYVIKLGQL